MMPPEKFHLADLLTPFGLEVFLLEIWDRRHLLVRRDDPAYYSSLFGFSDVDKVLFLARERTGDLLTTVPKIKTEGSEIRSRIADIPVRDLYRHFHAGDTIRVADIHRSWPPLLPLVQSISQTLVARVDVNLYLTPEDSQGFPTHVDHEDVFILQVGGSKEWFLYNPDHPWPLEGVSYLREQGGYTTPRRDESSLLLAEHVVLKTGDFLYIPRGYPHKAITSGCPSLHLTIGIHPVYWLDLVKAALELVGEEEPELRRALPPGLGREPHTLEGMAETFATAILNFANKASFQEALDAVRASHSRPPGFLPDGHFASLASLGELRLDSEVERREGLECLVEHDGNHAVVRFSREQVRGPVSIAPALEFIRETSSFKVSQLPGSLDEESKLVLVRRLIKEGLLRIATL